MSRSFAYIDIADLALRFHANGCEPNEDDFEIYTLIENLGSDIKVRFDTENCEYESDNHNKHSLVGQHSLPNGLNFIGVTAGGDWESPVFFIVYWDGKKLRGYVPTDGNPWNTSTKQAYGNDEDADAENKKKRGFDPADEYIDFDWVKIAFDIANRLVFKK